MCLSANNCGVRLHRELFVQGVACSRQWLAQLYLEIKVAAIEATGLGGIGRLNLHGHRLALLGSVDRDVVELHGGDAAQINAALGGDAQRRTNLHLIVHMPQEQLKRWNECACDLEVSQHRLSASAQWSFCLQLAALIDIARMIVASC